MEFIDIRDIVEDHIKTGRRHENYKLFCDLSVEARQYVTGENQEVLIRGIRKHETEEQKDLRVEVTEPKTPEAISPVRTEFNRIYGVADVSESYGVNYSDNSKGDLQKALNRFHGNLTRSQYVNLQQSHFEFGDCNAWLIVERKNVYSGEGQLVSVQPYPVEVTSKEAINYEHENGLPVWLIMLREREEVVDDKPIKVEDYFFYTKGRTVAYREFISPANIPEERKRLEIVVVEIEDGDPRSFTVSEHETGGKEFPGIKWGAYRHMAHDDLTVKQPAFWAGRYLLRSILKGSSLKDVCKYLHVYPQKYVYDSECDYQLGDSVCTDGKVNGGECPKCHGSNSMIHKSEIDLIRISLPVIDDARELMPIDSFVHYAERPLDSTQWIAEDLEKDMKAFYMTVFNANKEQRFSALQTATAATFDELSMTNTVRPFADHNSRINEHIVRLSAQYMQEDEGLEYNHAYGQSLGLESEDYLARQIKNAKEAGAGHEIINAYYAKWIAKQYPEQPEVYNNWSSFEAHKPFVGFAEGSVFGILQDRDPADFDRVLFENFDAIKRELLVEQPRFYQLKYSRQVQLIGDKVTDKISSIKLRQETPAAPLDLSFGEAA